VVSLSAVDPNRLGVVHWDSISRELGSIVTDRIESRVKTTSHSSARQVEGGLSSGMVFLVELEGDGVSGLSSNGVRREREITGTANDNTMIGASAGGGGRRRAHGRGRGGSGLWRGYGARSTAAGQCVRFVGGELVSRVDGEDHPLLTVICLSAVHPKRVGCLDDELSNGEGPIHIIGGDWYKSGIKTINGVLARAGKSGLGDGVIFLLEGEDHDVSRLGSHRLRGKSDARAAHGHVDLDSSHLDCGGSEESGEL